MSLSPRRSLAPLALLAVGAVAGSVGTAVLSPASLKAEAVDRNEKMAVFTSPLSIGRPGEAVFVLDSTTGTLVGGVLGNGGFNTSYARSIAADFGDRAGLAEYAVVAGSTDNGAGVIYIAENRSGVVVAYGIPDGSGRQFPLVPAGKFNFKAAMQ
ncbi:hypothetical protein [Alienimonas californiensis]|uniref:Uncharacterized protein n=1 Tax=Alienimonas californiensis TaxID=2527989 RepID=A0A517PCX7_9PLAN|nr:hypothetical protein [Alienimonas californiensis]QDT17234.1 hypothetical protein CA12_33470 [Alienimonas californiensis]